MVAVNKIIPLSSVDGAGARTAIFLQGCNITCKYCHNPETQRVCIHCGKCVGGCPVKALSIVEGKVCWNKDLCVACDACIKTCLNFSSPKISFMSAIELMSEIEKNIPFIRGITVSGGECMLQADFLAELFMLAKKKDLTCFIDTNGTVDFSQYPLLVANCDGVMLDVKAWDKNVYKELTKNVDNSIVKKNISFLADSGILEEIRIVCFDGIDVKDIIIGIHGLIGEKLPTLRIKLITFRNNGVRGALENALAPTKEKMLESRDFCAKYFENVVLV